MDKKKLKEVNADWGRRLINNLNAHDAAILFGFGMNEKGTSVYWMTQDCTPQEMAIHLRKIADSLEQGPSVVIMKI